MTSLMHCTNGTCGRFWGRDSNRPGEIAEALDAEYDE
jgi:hypothetical protein